MNISMRQRIETRLLEGLIHRTEHWCVAQYWILKCQWKANTNCIFDICFDKLLVCRCATAQSTCSILHILSDSCIYSLFNIFYVYSTVFGVFWFHSSRSLCLSSKTFIPNVKHAQELQSTYYRIHLQHSDRKYFSSQYFLCSTSVFSAILSVLFPSVLLSHYFYFSITLLSTARFPSAAKIADTL